MKRIVSILISLLMGLSCAVSFIGCTKQPGNNSSFIEDSTSDSSSSSTTEDLSKELDEYLPAVEKLTSNIEDISVADIKNSEGDVLSLVFRGVTVGNIFKNIMQYSSQEGPVVINIDRYKDGKWRCGTKATEIDSDLNLIFEYQLFSGPLNISQERLELVRDQHILDLLMGSLLNTNFSIEKTLEMMEKQGDAETGSGTGSLPMMPDFGMLMENKAVYNFVKPLLLLTIGDFYDITVDFGVSYIQNTYGAMDVDSYIDLCAYALTMFVQGDFEAASKLMRDLINGTISSPVFNGDLAISQLIDDVLAIAGVNDAEVVDLLKTSIGGTVSQPELIILNDVETFVKNYGRILALGGIGQAQVDLIKNLLSDLLVDGEQGIEINLNQKVAKIIADIPFDDEIKAVLVEQFGDMTIGELFATPKDYCDKINSVIAAVKKSVNNSAEEVSAEITDTINRLESLFGIIKKYVDAEDVTAFKLAEVCNDLMLACEAILPADYSGITDAVFLVMGQLYMELLPNYAEVTIAETGAAFAALDFDSTISQLGSFVKQIMGSDEAMTAQVDSVVTLIQMFADGTFAELQFNSELTVVGVINQVKAVLTAFGFENRYVSMMLDDLSSLYAETTVVGIVDDTLDIQVDDAISSVFYLVSYVCAGNPEQVAIIKAALTTLFDGTLAAPELSNDALSMTVSEFMTAVGASAYLEAGATLQKFADFTLGELFTYTFGENEQLDEVVVEVVKGALLSFIDQIKGETTLAYAA